MSFGHEEVPENEGNCLIGSLLDTMSVWLFQDNVQSMVVMLRYLALEAAGHECCI